ncbi:AGE family epimerase/isomerase [Salinicola halophilus]|uniref:AGE family epimerase/isomerase n=1 Tax=Salinicola halophilus TaxID=184065 RepID=UPI000DA22B96|nr:AGE family epimerase/isomerase [Salinicola halophilus]
MPLTSSREIAHQIERIVQFYHPRCIDTHAGFHHYFGDDGRTYNPGRRHLLSSVGFVTLYADEARRTDSREALSWARHGLRYLESTHFQTRTGDYAWTLDHGEPDSATYRVSGLVGVIDAYAAAAGAGIEAAQAPLRRELKRLETRYFDSDHGLYVDAVDAQGRWQAPRTTAAQLDVVASLIGAFAVTAERGLIERALAVTRLVWHRLAPVGDGWLWPHYDAEWRPDFSRHRFARRQEALDGRSPQWGVQIGEQLGWVRQLVALSRHFPRERWLLETAERRFTQTMAAGWDRQCGGMIQSVDFDREPLGRDKCYWVQARGLAAAAELHALTGQARFGRAFDKLMGFVWQHVIDHERGGWHDRLTPDNRRYSREKSPAPKVDQAALQALQTLLRLAERRETGLSLAGSG